MPDDPEGRGRLLTALARASIASQFGEAAPDLPHPPWLGQAGAVFVTLTQAGELRGCIGTLEAHRPLAEDVEENARMAAFLDPRFQPLMRDELERTRVEVSVLSRPEAMSFTDESDALRQLHPGMDGVILEYGRHRATFLPQVWEQLPEPGQFMAQLKRKAGLAPDFWAEGVRLSRYTVEKYEESVEASLKED
jgi:AmmeMemoRadiSam system protein A